jgi:hypothetical protein
MAKVPKGTTVYTRGPKYTEGQELPDHLMPKAPVPAPKKEPKKEK